MATATMVRRRTTAVWWMAWLAVATCVLAACGGSDGSDDEADASDDTVVDEGEPVDGGSLIVGVGAETSGWNPSEDRWAQPGALVGSSVLEPLATLDADAVAQPLLATEWVPNESFDSWTVTLRDDVRFQNGEPFDAEAVQRNIEAVIAAPLSGVALNGLFAEEPVTVIDDHTVQVDLLVSWAAFPSSFLAGQSALMKAPEMLDAEDRGRSHPIGTGPFTFDSWEPGNVFKTLKNDDYWQEGLPHVDELEFRVLPDAASRAAALESGDVDMIMTTSAQDADTLEAADYTVVRNWGTEPAMLMTNVRPEVGGEPNPLNNEHARLALAYATDRDAIAATVGEGVETPTSPFSPENPWGAPSDENGYPDYDPAQAEEEIQAYLDDTGESSLSVTITGEPDVNTLTILQQVQQQWEDVGIEVELESIESSAFINNVVAGNYEIALFRIYSSPDPDQNYYFWGSATAQDEGEISINFTGYTTPEMDEALSIGRESGDFETRKAAYNDLVHAINEAAVNIWLYWTPYSLVANPRVHGLQGENVEFGNFQPKDWLADLWVDS